MNINSYNKTDSFIRNTSQQEFITSNDVITRYDITAMTLWRWIKSEKVAFPKPLYINKRRYFRISDVHQWEINRQNGEAE